MTLYEILTDPESGVGIPVAYSHFKGDEVPESPPYMVYIGNGQNTMDADNTHYYRQNRYQLEYYFINKDEETEAQIEDILLENGYLYEKSEDIFIEDEEIFVIYYMI
ncbi:MAG: hypothetical protein IJI87_07420 [Mogibacterium sp.]|nr:hypothetical protein [Mogibacterium sp.]